MLALLITHGCSWNDREIDFCRHDFFQHFYTSPQEQEQQLSVKRSVHAWREYHVWGLAIFPP